MKGTVQHMRNMASKKNRIMVIIISGMLAALSIYIIKCALEEKSKEGSPISYSETRECFGTIVTLNLYSLPGKGAKSSPLSQADLRSSAEMLFSEAERLELIFSAKLPDSELSRVNAAAAHAPVEISEELFFVFSLALRYGELSNGALDISLGGLIKLWDIGGENEGIPESLELSKYLGKCSFRDIVLNEKDNTVFYRNSYVNTDLGAIAKGYAGDRLKELAEEAGIQHALLNLGGNIVTIGSKYNGQNWSVGIADPENPSSFAAAVKITDICAVTSGNYQRYFIYNGIRYHHILDPATGYPADKGLSSVTIFGESSAHCDALSTACYVLGLTDGMKLIEALQGYEAVFIDDGGRLHQSSGMDKYMD